jgi:hypothetical protein
VPCPLKNRASNYRVVINEKPDYVATRSNPTSRQSASRRSCSPARSKATASLRFKSGDLNPLHLDRAVLSLAFQAEDKDGKVRSSTENSTEKHRMKEKKNHHHKVGNKFNNGQHKQQRRPYACNSSARRTIVAPCHSTPGTQNDGNGASQPHGDTVLEPSSGPLKVNEVFILIFTNAERNRVRKEHRPQVHVAHQYFYRKAKQVRALGASEKERRVRVSTVQTSTWQGSVGELRPVLKDQLLAAQRRHLLSVASC